MDRRSEARKIQDKNKLVLDWFNDCVVSEWLEKLKQDIPHGPDTVCAVCETGDRVEDLIVLNSSGLLCEVESIFIVKKIDIQKMWKSFKGEFERYRDGRQGKIYWRLKPTLFRRDSSVTLWARFFIAKEAVANG